MANLNAAIQQIRRARSRIDAPPPRNFDRYREVYGTVLSETADLAGDDAFEELTEWLLETTAEREELPSPSSTRAKAREICADRDVSIPLGSPLLG